MGVYKFRWYGCCCLPPVDGDVLPEAQSANAPLRRSHRPAETVIVTGTFDSWANSEALDRVGDGFEKTVRIDGASDKIYYKVGGVLFLAAL